MASRGRCVSMAVCRPWGPAGRDLSPGSTPGGWGWGCVIMGISGAAHLLCPGQASLVKQDTLSHPASF